ncbi:MAG: tRNA pseudouridine(55) synthase TruB [Acidobacteriaceae bacterium]|nr:tRNA pseudouridine(55) synthase TruB [Acidobacteriaceae bacterium]
MIVVDKPEGWTSHDAVGKVRRICREKSVGHLGTLDPLATGVLPLILGRATRLARFFTGNDKRYDALVRFGITTDSYDRDGDVVGTAENFHVDREQVEAALKDFRGEIQQMPPPICAKKVSGVRAYKLARKKVAVELEPVPVMIHSLEITEFDGNTARLLVHCGAGTYLRSIAHDLGQKLGCGAILQALRRLSSGVFTIEQAHTLDSLQGLADAGDVVQALIPAEELLPEFPAERVDSITARQIRQGRLFRVSPFRLRPDTRFVKAITDDGQLLAIGEVRLPHTYHPILVL